LDGGIHALDVRVRTWRCAFLQWGSGLGAGGEQAGGGGHQQYCAHARKDGRENRKSHSVCVLSWVEEEAIFSASTSREISPRWAVASVPSGLMNNVAGRPIVP